MNQVRVNGYVRISKQKARRLYDNGENIYLLPCKVSPASEWIRPYQANDYLEYQRSFDRVLASFEYYNCQYNELGKYPAFYIKEI